MPKCAKCQEIFPPNYTETIENSSRDSQGDFPQHCIFCKLGINEVERETENKSGIYTKYTKQECLTDYKIFLKNLKDNRNVKDILEKTSFSPRIIL